VGATAKVVVVVSGTMEPSAPGHKCRRAGVRRGLNPLQRQGHVLLSQPGTPRLAAASCLSPVAGCPLAQS
jgi:hypothetical protein